MRHDLVCEKGTLASFKIESIDITDLVKEDMCGDSDDSSDDKQSDDDVSDSDIETLKSNLKIDLIDQ